MRTKIDKKQVTSAPVGSPPAGIFDDDEPTASISTRVENPMTTSKQLVVASAPSLSTRLENPMTTSEAMLDAALNEFGSAIKRAGAHYAEACVLAKALLELHWQQRTEQGKPKYRSANAFIVAEIEPRFGIRKSKFYEMVRIADEGLAPDVAIFGITAANILASVPADARGALRDARQNGATTRELTAAAEATNTKKKPASTKPRTKPRVPTYPANDSAPVYLLHAPSGRLKTSAVTLDAACAVATFESENGTTVKVMIYTDGTATLELTREDADESEAAQ